MNWRPTLSLAKLVRKVIGVIRLAIAPTWDKDIAKAFADAEVELTIRFGDVAKDLCQKAASTQLNGIQKLGSVVTDLVELAIKQGVKADALVLTVVAQKAYAQIKKDAPELLANVIRTIAS